MKNLVEVLKHKQHELETLQRQMDETQREIEALRMALRLCAENDSEAMLAESRPLKMAVAAEASISTQAAQGMRKFP